MVRSRASTCIVEAVRSASMLAVWNTLELHSVNASVVVEASGILSEDVVAKQGFGIRLWSIVNGTVLDRHLAR